VDIITEEQAYWELILRQAQDDGMIILKAFSN
jgi:hypothetical protein